MRVADPLSELLVADAAAWRTWLSEHHGDEVGVELVLAKKGTTEPTSLTYEQALDEALCHGWIDGQAAPPRRAHLPPALHPPARAQPVVGAQRRPRRAAARRRPDATGGPGRGRSAPRPTAAGRPPIRVRRRSRCPTTSPRRWPPTPRAQANFELLSSQNRYAVLYRIHSAKRSDTRARRIDEYVAMLARGETLHPQKRALAK